MENFREHFEDEKLDRDGWVEEKTSSNISIYTDGDIKFYSDEHKNSITIKSMVKWYKRIWYIIANPFYYIFCGKIRY